MFGSAVTIHINTLERTTLREQLLSVMSAASSEAVISMLMYGAPVPRDFDQYDINWSEALGYYQHVIVERSAESARFINRLFVENTLITTGMVVRAIHNAVGKKICEFY